MKILVLTVAFGSYHAFIPYFIFTTLLHNPHYFVKVITDRESMNLTRALNIIKQISSNFEVIYEKKVDFRKEVIPNYPLGKYYKILFHQPHVQGFDYVYFADADHILLKTDINKVERGIEIMEKLGTTFYNNVVSIKGVKNRLCNASHLVNVKKYLEKYGNKIDHYRQDINRVKELGLMDEKFLYQLMDKEEIDKISNSEMHVSYMGFNVGALRLKSREKWVKDVLKNTNIRDIINHPIFVQITKQMPHKQIYCLINIHKMS